MIMGKNGENQDHCGVNIDALHRMHYPASLASVNGTVDDNDNDYIWHTDHLMIMLMTMMTQMTRMTQMMMMMMIDDCTTWHTGQLPWSPLTTHRLLPPPLRTPIVGFW